MHPEAPFQHICLWEGVTSSGCLQAPGAKMLAQGLASNGSLEVLSLAWNGLENDGCIHIAQMFHQNRVLKVRHAPPSCMTAGSPCPQGVHFHSMPEDLVDSGRLQCLKLARDTDAPAHVHASPVVHRGHPALSLVHVLVLLSIGALHKNPTNLWTNAA